VKVIVAILCLAGSSLAVDHRALLWGGVNLGLASLDYETALHVQATRPCYESDPIWGSTHPSRATFYGRGLPLDIGVEAFGYWLGSKVPHHKKFKWLPFRVVSGWHAYGTYTNLTCGRSLR